MEAHAPVWDEAIAHVMELADAMPEDYYDFKPPDSVRTFSGQLIHIGASSKVIANMFLKDIRPEGPPPDMDVSAMTKAEIVAFVKTNLEETGEIMKSMSDEQLAEKVKSFSGNEMTRLEGLLFVHDHLTNHKGKANLYVRISGKEPPNYRYYWVLDISHAMTEQLQNTSNFKIGRRAILRPEKKAWTRIAV